jgi:hypothetical protein
MKSLIGSVMLWRTFLFVHLSCLLDPLSIAMKEEKRAFPSSSLLSCVMCTFGVSFYEQTFLEFLPKTGSSSLRERSVLLLLKLTLAFHRIIPVFIDCLLRESEKVRDILDFAFKSWLEKMRQEAIATFQSIFMRETKISVAFCFSKRQHETVDKVVQS